MMMRRTVLVLMAGLVPLAGCQRKPTHGPRPPAAPGAPPAASAPAPTSPASPASMPQRKPGLWLQKVTSEGRTQVSRICLDRAVEQRFTWWGQHAARGACGQAKVSPHVGGGWTFASSCDMGENGKLSTTGTVSGDLSKDYKLTAESTITGAAAPQMNGAHRMTLEASWQGPCPAGMQPGDMVLPGGMKINMLHMGER
jgi:hypothetical protein